VATARMAVAPCNRSIAVALDRRALVGPTSAGRSQIDDGLTVISSSDRARSSTVRFK
jgi:hypothetical protein